MRNAKHMTEMINKHLVGGKITTAIIDDSDEYDQRFGFRVENGNKSFDVWVDCDAEGNAAGWLAILNFIRN